MLEVLLVEKGDGIVERKLFEMEEVFIDIFLGSDGDGSQLDDVNDVHCVSFLSDGVVVRASQSSLAKAKL
jgi:hypothetical protein